MRAVLLADAHLDGPGDPLQERFLRFLRELEADALFVLGDLFHRWWAFGPRRERPFPAYEPVLEALLGLRARGLRLGIVEGNHDFRLEPFRLEGVEAGGRLRLELDGLRLLLAHGDELDPRPGARATRRLLRGRAFAALLDGMGPERAWNFLGRLAGAPHAPPRPDARLESAQHRAGLDLLRGPVDAVVFAHTHRFRMESLPGGWLANPGAWDAGSYLVLEDGRFRRASLEP